MALADILTARAQAARATATVDCGALGTVTIEALPLRELERFTVGADGDRGLFFAACRDLQKAGAQLMEQGKLARPDGILAWVSAEEAKRAATAVRKLSGWTEQAEREADAEEASPVEHEPAEHTQPPVAETSAPAGEEWDALPETRPVPVAATGDEAPSPTTAKEDSVEQTTDEPQAAGEDRPVTVEGPSTKSAEEGQTLPDSPTPEIRQALEPDRTRPTDRQAPEKEPPRGKAPARLPAMEVEKPTAVQDAVPKATDAPVPTLHETETTFTETPAPDRQDIVPEAGDSPLRPETDSGEQSLQGPETELAERVAQCLLDGLRQASWVR